MKYTLVTGASAGIGKAIAYKFASKGHNLILVARRNELLKEIQSNIQEQFKVKVIIVSADLSRTKIVDELYNKLKSYDIELLINNAGFGNVSDGFENYDEKLYEQMIDLNVKALTTLTIKFIKDNFETDKQIINVSSIAGYSVSGSSSVYSATKFFVSSFTEGIDYELKRQGSKMRAKILAPGVTETEFFDVALKNSNKKEQYMENLKNRKSKTSEDLANYAWALYNSDARIGIVDRDTNEFSLKDKIYDVH